MARCGVIAVFCLGLLAVQAKAETTYTQNAVWLDPIVVSASLEALPLSEVASSASVIDAQQMQDRQDLSVGDALEGSVGVDLVNQGGAGQPVAAFLRGASSERTLVLLDGVILNDPILPGRNVDLANLTLDQVDRIEVVRGPQSVLYGSSAMGGIINILTKRPQAEWRSSLSLDGGQYSTWIGRLNTSGTVQDLGVSLAGSWEKSASFSTAKRTQTYPLPQPAMENDDYRIGTVDLGLTYPLAPELKLKAQARYSSSDTALDNYGGDNGDDPNYRLQAQNGLVSLNADWTTLKGLWSQSWQAGLNQIDRQSRNDKDPQHPDDASASSYHSRSLQVQWQNHLELASWNLLTLGSGYQQELGQSNETYQYLNFIFVPVVSISAFPETSAHTWSVFLEEQLHWGELLTTLGLRYDQHSQFGKFTTFRVTPSYRWTPTQTRFKATYGTAFNAPSLYQLYSPDYGNPKLQPETSSGWDLGVEQGLWEDRLLLGLTYFNSDYDQLIDFYTDPFTYRSSYQNQRQAVTKGWEASLTHHPWDWLDLVLGYTKLTANDVSAGYDQPVPLLRRADYRASLALTGHWEAIRASLTAQRVGPRWDADFDTMTYVARQVSLPAYTLVNLALSYTLDPRVELHFRINNLLDTDYVEVLGYSTSRFAAYAGTTIRWP